MGQILQLPVQASKPGYKRVRRPSRCAENPNQLDLFTPPAAQILEFASPNQGPFARALLWDERGDERAAGLYQKAIEEKDCPADAFCNLGVIESQKGATVKALDCFTRALQQDPRHVEAHYNLANLYFDQNDFRLAQLHFEMAAELDPSFANARFNLALAQAINNDFAAAKTTLAVYQSLVSLEEGRIAAELLNHLKQSIDAATENQGRGASNQKPGNIARQPQKAAERRS